MSDATHSGAEHAPAAGIVAASVTPITSPPALVRAAPLRPAAGPDRPVAQHPSAPPRLQRGLRQLLPQAQYRVARLGTAGQVGAVGLLAAVLLAIGMLLPAWRAIDGLNAAILSAQHAALQPAARGADTVGTIAQSLPSREQVPAVVGSIYEQARTAGVALESGRYAYTPGKAGGFGRYDMQFPVKAAYPQIREFINGTLKAVPAAGLAKLHVERRAVGDATVHADIDLVVFVRE